MKKNVSGQKIGVQMCSATDGSAVTGSVTVSVTGDAGTQATGSVGSGACTHEGNGYHTYAPAQAETNYDLVAFTFTGTGAIPATVQVFTTFPQSVDLSTGITGGTITTVTNLTNLPTIPANWLTAAGTAADFGVEIAGAVWNEDATGHQTQGTFGQAIGDPAADTNTIYKAVVTDAAGATVGVDVVAVKAETASIQADTNDLQTQIGTAGAGLTNINLPDQTMNITGDITGNLSGSVGSVGNITVSGGIVSADIKKVNAITVDGDGQVGTEWGPV